MALIPFFEILSSVGFTLNLLHTLVWVIAILYYSSLYQEVLKNINRCWLYIYIGMIAALISEIFNTIAFIIPEAEIVGIIFELVMVVGFVAGFIKLGKMLDAF